MTGLLALAASLSMSSSSIASSSCSHQSKFRFHSCYNSDNFHCRALFLGYGKQKLLEYWAEVFGEMPQRTVLASIIFFNANFDAHVIGGKPAWFLAWAQGCIQFSIAVFWILWVPTVVPFGLEVSLALVWSLFAGC
ncbi:hypothetical protein Vadar_028539 [Vaccinium darrowii]|uniref:Uncharacterized protein n=1 Tax=Vaccinium darrowii TaxID=229202 RepID=A0ACB7ZMG3_9ERIC|nr:hypothetical protein Vadar_028539 [Vaccinium darrowii]